MWTTLSLGLGAIERLVPDEDRPRFAAFVRSLAGPTLSRLGWKPAEGEDELTSQLRGSLITLLGTSGADPEVRGRAREVHASYLDDPTSVDPNVAAAVVGVIASDGNDEDFERFLERHLASPSPQEALRYLYSLSAFPSRELAERLLPMTLDRIRSQNAPFTILLSLANRDVNDLVWEFVKTEWDAINARFPDNAIPRMLGGITALSTPELAADVTAFLADHPVPQGAKMIEQSLERLRVNVALREREAARVAEALEHLRPS